MLSVSTHLQYECTELDVVVDALVVVQCPVIVVTNSLNRSIMSAPSGSDDIDLTNLNWVPGAPVPLPANFSVSPPDQKSPGTRIRGSPFSPFRGCTTISNTSSPASQSRPVEIVVTSPWRNENVSTPQSPSVLPVVLHDYSNHPATPLRRRNNSISDNNSEHKKPNCSYTCLIGMALKASPGTDGCLPVNEIYKYIEKEFPYFKTAPDGWKNSVRHNLSLNPSFRKVTRTDGWQGKKGFFWEIAPEKKEAVNSEVDTFLKSMGRELQPHSTLLTSPIQPTLRQGRFPRQSTPCKVATPRQQSTPCKVNVRRQSTPCRVTVSKVTPPNKQIVKPLPDIAQYSPQIQDQIIASQMQVRSEPSPTQREFDMDNTPSEYIGIEAPSADPNESARELFGLDTTPMSKDQQCQEQCNSGNGSDGPLVPLYTPITPFYGTIYGYPYPVANSSPSPLIAISPPSHFVPQYLPPQYMHYLPNSQTGVVYGPAVGNQMMFGMGYNAPKFIDGNNLEMDTMENSSNDRDPRSEETNEDEVLRHKQAPSTPTSHFAHGNGHAQKRLRLNDDAAVSPTHLADTEGKNVSVDNILSQLLGQSNECIDGVGVHELSDHEKDHYLQQFLGFVDLDNVFKSSQNSFHSSPCTPLENTVSSFEENGCHSSVRSSSPLHRFESLLEINDQNIKCMQDGLTGDQQEAAQLDSSSIIYPQSPLCTEEVIIETYQG